MFQNSIFNDIFLFMTFWRKLSVAEANAAPNDGMIEE
jgi:hypothetical protein